MGRIVTFYSYKGGVGRTFLLANVAVLLARWGQRVLCIDWDLEAPGLHHYFGSSMGRRVVSRFGAGSRVGTPLRRYASSRDPDVAGGVLDIVSSVAAGDPCDWRDMVIDIEGDEDWRIDLLPAGVPGDGYVKKLHALDWDALYQEHAFGWTLEQMRAQWLAAYDLVLVDSRTGLTDIGGICAAQLPDILVVLSCANQQSVLGCLDIIERAKRARNRLPVPRPGPLILPLVSRFDEREEYDDAAHWLQRFAEAWAESYRVWAVDGTEPRKLLNLLRIPYVSKWSFGEHLPARAERIDDPGLISWSVANVAACLAHGLGRTEVLLSNRDAYVDRAMHRRESVDVPVRYDVFLSHEVSEVDAARRLHEALSRRGLRVHMDMVGGSDLHAEPVRRSMVEQIAKSRSFVPLVTAAWTSSDLAKAGLIAALSRPRAEMAVVPVRVGEWTNKEQMDFTADLPGIDTDQLTAAEAEEVAAQIERELDTRPSRT